MKRSILYIVFLAISLAFGQGSNPEYYQPRRIVNMPNAGLLPDRAWMGEIRLVEDGGLVAYAGLGLRGRIQAGVSYGAHGVLGRGDPTAYPRPSFQMKIRPFNEKQKFPAIVLGYDDQGTGLWDKELKRYSLKSPGFYLAASKNWTTLGGNLGLHAGLNYSLETKDNGKGFDAYFGLDKNLGDIFAIYIEYVGGINDNDTKDGVYGSGKGYLNASLKWSVRPDFEIELILADLLVNNESAGTFSREVRLSFVYPL